MIIYINNIDNLYVKLIIDKIDNWDNINKLDNIDNLENIDNIDNLHIKIDIDNKNCAFGSVFRDKSMYKYLIHSFIIF